MPVIQPFKFQQILQDEPSQETLGELQYWSKGLQHYMCVKCVSTTCLHTLHVMTMYTHLTCEYMPMSVK